MADAENDFCARVLSAADANWISVETKAAQNSQIPLARHDLFTAPNMDAYQQERKRREDAFAPQKSANRTDSSRDELREARLSPFLISHEVP